MTDFSFQKYILFGVHSAKSLKRKKNIIFCLKKYKNIWYDLTFLYIQKKFKKYICMYFWI